MRGWMKSAAGLLKSATSAPVNANVAMASVSGTSITLPTHASGDYLVMWAYRTGNNNTPTVPAGWTAITPTGLQGASTSNCGVLAYKVAASSSEVSGTWTNAAKLIVAVVKAAGAGPLGLGNNGGLSVGSAPVSSTVPYAAITLANTNGRSVVLAFGGQRDATNFNNAVSGMTIGANVSSGSAAGGHYTTTGVTSFAATAVNIGGGTFGYASATVEITNAA